MYEKAYNQEFVKPGENVSRNYFNQIDYFNEKEYNNDIPIEIKNPKTSKLIRDEIGRSTLKPGVYEIELYDYGDEQYKIYTINYKSLDNWKIVDEEVEDRYAINKSSKETASRDGNSRSRIQNNVSYYEQNENTKTATNNVGLFNSNKGYTNTSRKNNTQINRNQEQRTIKNSEKGSINLPINRKYDIGGINGVNNITDNETRENVINNYNEAVKLAENGANYVYNVADYDEKEYNDISGIELPKQQYARLSEAVAEEKDILNQV